MADFYPEMDGVRYDFPGEENNLVLDHAGNARGTGAVDLQTSRTADTQVVSAATLQSGILCGYNNQVDGNSSVIVGGANNLIEAVGCVAGGSASVIGTGSNYSVCLGVNNTIGDDAEYTAILGGGAHNIGDDCEWCNISGGNDNEIIVLSAIRSYASNIAGGRNCSIQGSNYCSILGGRDHTISRGADNGTYNTICGGYSATIDNCTLSFIGNGYDPTMTDSDYAFMGGGNSNSMNESDRGGIHSGQAHVMDNASYSTITGGYDCEIRDCLYAMCGGRSNRIQNVASSTHNSTICGGTTNVIEDSVTGVICGGNGNQITDQSDISVLCGGFSNLIDGSTYGALVGGWNCEIKGGSDYSFVGGGQENVVNTTDNHCVICGGDENTITGGSYTTIGGGRENTISASDGTVCGGFDNEVTGISAVVIGGQRNHADSDQSIAMGRQAKTSLFGERAHATGRNVDSGRDGSAQESSFVSRCKTTNATATEMFLDGSGASETLELPPTCCWAFTILVSGIKTGGTQGAGYEFKGCVRRTSAATSTTSLVGTVTKTVLGEDDSNWDATVDVNGDDLRIRVTGVAATNIEWCAVTNVSQVLNAIPI